MRGIPMPLTSDKRQYLYYLMDFICVNDKWHESIRDILYCGVDYNEINVHSGISKLCKIKPISFASFIRDRKINEILFDKYD